MKHEPTPLRIRALSASLLLLATLPSCGGGGGGGALDGGDDPLPGTTHVAGCLSGTWSLAVTDIGDLPACLDLGLDGIQVELEGAVGAVIQPGVVNDPYFVDSQAIDVQVPGFPWTTLSATYLEFPGAPLGIPGAVRLLAPAGAYYLPSLDVTVQLSTGPSNEQYGQVQADCNAFVTFVEYEVFDGDAMVLNSDGAGGVSVSVDPFALQLCEGELLISGVRTESAMGTTDLMGGSTDLAGSGRLPVRGEREAVR